MDIKSQPVALLFAGQGNPAIGMGADLWNINHPIRRIWDCASDISGIDIRRICLKGPMNKLIKTPVQQLAVTAINISLYHLLQERIGNITASCGHSVGEYSALYAAGVLTLEQLFSVIHFRATTMHQLSQIHKGAMLVVKGKSYQATRDLIASADLALDISCDNSRYQQVVGGTLSALGAFSRQAGEVTGKLGVSGAWHTRLMQDGVQPMRDHLSTVPLEPPRHKIVMNVSGQPADQPELIRENLSLHLTHTVKWTDSVTHLLASESPLLLIEISHKAWLTTLLHDFPHFSPQMALHCKNILCYQ